MYLKKKSVYNATQLRMFNNIKRITLFVYYKSAITAADKLSRS
jgi:hypothetical protein